VLVEKVIRVQNQRKHSGLPLGEPSAGGGETWIMPGQAAPAIGAKPDDAVPLGVPEHRRCVVARRIDRPPPAPGLLRPAGQGTRGDHLPSAMPASA
jgi:hypothetical protein